MVGSNLNRFADRTSLHGVPHVIQSKTNKGKMFWALVCILSMCSLGYYIYQILQRYLQYEKNVGIEVQKVPIQFPQITVCNMNAIPSTLKGYISSRFYQDQEKPYKQIQGNMNKVYNDFFLKYLKYIVQISSLKNLGGKVNKVIENSDFSNKIIGLTGLAANLGIEEVMTISNPLNILKCRYQHKMCNTKIDAVFNSLFYKCIVLSLYDSKDEPLFVNQVGSDNGLSLWVYIDSKQSFRLPIASQNMGNSESETRGLRVKIEEPNMCPFPLNEGINIAPETYNSISFKASRILRIDEPYGNCRQPEVNYYKNYSYSMQLCETLCTQKFLYKQCGCMELSYPLLENVDNNVCFDMNRHNELCEISEDKTLCSVLAYYKEFLCFRNFTEKFRLTTDSCDCLPSCNETAYSFQISSIKWPGVLVEHHYETYANHTMEDEEKIPFLENMYDYETENITKKEKLEIVKRIFDDTAKIDLYLSDINTVVVTETVGYGEAQVIADIGGMLGLFLGLSFITAVEILSFLIRIVHRWLNRAKDGPMKDQDHRSQENGFGTEEAHIRSSVFSSDYI